MSVSLELVPHERQAELAELEGRRAITLRALVAELARRASSTAAAAAEVTRLACARALGRSFRYAAAVDQAIAGLRRAGVGPAELGALQVPRARELARVVSAVDAELEGHGLRDERGDAWLAAQAARAGELGPLAGMGTLMVRGLCRYDAGELALLEAVHAALVNGGGNGVVLELPRVELAPAPTALERVARELEARWANDADHPALEFREARRELEVELVPAQDDASEARVVARTILDALGRGVALDRMAIAVPELSEAFLEPLRRELEAARIPFFEPRGRPLLAAPHAHAALELMKLAAGPVDRDQLLDVLRTPGLDARRWTAEAIEREEWASELAQLPLRIDRSGGELLAELEGRAAELERDGGDAGRTRAALAATERCLQELARHRAAQSRSALRASWLPLLGELGLMGPSAGLLAAALERRAAGRRELLRAVGDNGTAVRALATAFERVSQAAAALGRGSEAVELTDFLVELELSAQGVNPQRGARRGAALWIARPEELAGLELELTVLCRATSSRIEAAGGGEAELLSDDIIGGLPARRRPVGRSLGKSFGNLAVAWLLCGARRAVVTYPLRDGRGPATPSQFVLGLAAQGKARETEPVSPLHERARRLSPLLAPSLDAARRARVDAERQGYFLDPDAAPGPFTGAAGDIAELVGGSAARPLAVTALETYARCPFLAFSSYVLRASRDEVPGDGIGVRERGSLIHAALAAAHEAMRPLWGLRDGDELERLALAAARAYLDRRGQGALRRAGLSAAYFDVAAAVRWSLQQGRDLPFLEAERGFGRGQGWTALQLGEHWVGGRIDRIDAAPGGARARIIDYKTGKPPSAKKLNEELLQPWLYGLKVAQELGASEVESGYLSLSDRAPRLNPSVAITADSEQVQAALERAQRSLLKLASGAVEPRPRQAKSCVRCDGRDLCRRPLSAPLAAEEDEA